MSTRNRPPDALGVLDLVQVARLTVVYRRPEKPAQILNAAAGSDLHVFRLGKLARDLAGELGLEARLGDGAARDCVQVRRVSLLH